MAITNYFKTEKDYNTGKLTINGWLWFSTSINVTAVKKWYKTANGSQAYQSIAPATTNIYCHIEAPTEPSATDGSILTTDFSTTGSETDTEYSATGAPVTIKSFTSETGFFTSDQDFDSYNSTWGINYNNKYINATPGYSPWMDFEFYKRDVSANDTLLFKTRMPQHTFYLGNGYTGTFSPSGEVSASDRLRIRVVGGESIPT